MSKEKKYIKVGRPRLSEEEKVDVAIKSIRLTKEQLNIIDKICNDNDITFSEFCNTCFTTCIQIYREMYKKD